MEEDLKLCGRVLPRCIQFLDGEFGAGYVFFWRRVDDLLVFYFDVFSDKEAIYDHQAMRKMDGGEA